MNKKLIKTIASITCGLGIISSIPFASSSCGSSNRKTLNFDAVSDFINYDFNKWKNDIGINNKDYTYNDKYTKENDSEYIKNITSDLKSNETYLKRIMFILIFGLFEIQVCRLFLGDEDFTREEITSKINELDKTKFTFTFSYPNNIKWDLVRINDHDYDAVSFSNLSVNCYMSYQQEEINASVYFKDNIKFYFDGFSYSSGVFNGETLYIKLKSFDGSSFIYNEINGLKNELKEASFPSAFTLSSNKIFNEKYGSKFIRN